MSASVGFSRRCWSSPSSGGCVNHGRPKEVTKEHPHDITMALHGPVGKGLLMSEGSGRSTFSCRPGRRPMAGRCSELPGSVRSRAPNICRGSFEHLIASSEHLDTLREIARPVRSMQKASREVVEATILGLCRWRYLTLDDLADLYSHLRCSRSSRPLTISASVFLQPRRNGLPLSLWMQRVTGRCRGTEMVP